MILVVSEPLETAAGLAGDDGLGAAQGLARWERFHRTALVALRGLPVFVTTRTSATTDPDWRRELSDFLVRHGFPVRSEAEQLSSPEPAPEDVPVPSAGLEDGTKDEELLLASQRQLASLLEQLAGAHECFDPPAPETESPWVATVLHLRRDLDQVRKDLVRATRRLASLLPGAAPAPATRHGRRRRLRTLRTPPRTSRPTTGGWRSGASRLPCLSAAASRSRRRGST